MPRALNVGCTCSHARISLACSYIPPPHTHASSQVHTCSIHQDDNANMYSLRDDMTLYDAYRNYEFTVDVWRKLGDDLVQMCCRGVARADDGSGGVGGGGHIGGLGGSEGASAAATAMPAGLGPGGLDLSAIQQQLQMQAACELPRKRGRPRKNPPLPLTTTAASASVAGQHASMMLPQQQNQQQHMGGGSGGGGDLGALMAAAAAASAGGQQGMDNAAALMMQLQVGHWVHAACIGRMHGVYAWAALMMQLQVGH